MLAKAIGQRDQFFTYKSAGIPASPTSTSDDSVVTSLYLVWRSLTTLGMGWGLVATMSQCFDTRGERYSGHDYARVLCR